MFLLLWSLLLTACGADAATNTSSEAASASVANGEKLFMERGCIACHPHQAGQVSVGPSLTGVASRSAQTITQSDYTGQAKTVEAYLHESITQPEVYLVKEYSPVMPKTYSRDLNEQQLTELVAYLMTLK
jgi:nitric oxide reductase subunit C